MMRRSRCLKCAANGATWCEHHQVLLVFMAGAPVIIHGESEESARKTADRLSQAWRGRPFHRRAAASSEVQT